MNQSPDCCRDGATAHAGLDDVADMKAQIHDATGIPGEQQRLIMEGKELCSPEARLADCLLCEGAVLQLVLTGDGRSRVPRARAAVSPGDDVLIHGLSSARGWGCRMRSACLRAVRARERERESLRSSAKTV